MAHDSYWCQIRWVVASSTRNLLWIWAPPSDIIVRRYFIRKLLKTRIRSKGSKDKSPWSRLHFDPSCFANDECSIIEANSREFVGFSDWIASDLTWSAGARLKLNRLQEACPTSYHQKRKQEHSKFKTSFYYRFTPAAFVHYLYSLSLSLFPSHNLFIFSFSDFINKLSLFSSFFFSLLFSLTLILFSTSGSLVLHIHAYTHARKGTHTHTVVQYEPKLPSFSNKIINYTNFRGTF